MLSLGNIFAFMIVASLIVAILRPEWMQRSIAVTLHGVVVVGVMFLLSPLLIMAAIGHMIGETESHTAT